MALITCPECGQSISNVADKCPHCGLPQSYFKTQATATKSNSQHQGVGMSSMQYEQMTQQPQYQAQKAISCHDNSIGGRAVKVAKPNNYLVLAILSMVIGGFFGIISLVYSLKVNNLYANGNYTEAISASKNTMIWAIVGIVIGVLSTVLMMLILEIIN